MKLKKILIVDDQPEHLMTLVEMVELANEHYEVLQALSGDLALDIARSEIPDLVITDWEMPGMNGLELVELLKADSLTADIPVIMCTGIMTTPQNLRTALEAGAVDYIRKPINRMELTARVRSMLALSESYNTIKQQKERVEELLLNTLPKAIVERLKEDKNAITTDYFTEVSILFADIVSFTKISESISPKKLVSELSIYFDAFDIIVEKFRLEKIKTIGDAYMCAGGIPIPVSDHALLTTKAALEILHWVDKRNKIKRKNNEFEWQVRCGIHSGDVIAGVVGKKKFAYDLWGDTVNTAARIESSGESGKVNISAATYELIKDQFNFSYRGKIKVKSKGEMDMYFVEGLSKST